MRLLAAFSYHHPSLFRDSHCSAEIPVLQSGGVELAASCFPEHRLQLLAGMDIPRGARAARRTPASGRAQLQRGRSPARTAALATRQRRAASSPSPPFLQKYLSLSLWLGLSGICENGCLQPPLIQMVSERRRPGGGQRGSPCLA